MVWIRGGKLEFHATGASAYYDGSRFARDGVVCGTINYRVAAEGFLYLGDGVANLGLLNQIAALEWVQENIGAFGGNPGSVTVFGESAGAMRVATLLSSANGLFLRAIVQRGTAHSVNPPTTAARISSRLAEKLGVPGYPAGDRRDFTPAPASSAGAVAGRASHAPDPAFWGEVALSYLPWAPTVDGETVPECRVPTTNRARSAMSGAANVIAQHAWAHEPDNAPSVLKYSSALTPSLPRDRPRAAGCPPAPFAPSPAEHPS